MATPAAVVSAFQELTGLGKSAVLSFFEKNYPNSNITPDFYEAISRARAAGLLGEENANIASIVHLTGIEKAKAKELLTLAKPRYDLYRAIEDGREGEYNRDTAVTAQLRVLTKMSLENASKFLKETTPECFLEAAIDRARDAHVITPQQANFAIFKVLTEFSDKLTSQLLLQSPDVAMAILLGEKFFDPPILFPLARLRFTFRLRYEDARRYLKRGDVNGDYEKAARQVKVDRVMDKVVVDRKDAYNHLQSVGGNVDQAVQLAKANQLSQPGYGGISADTRNPPDITPGTHIIGVLGVSDLGHQRRASPRLDGWMVSDFYLWMAVVEGLGKSQSWLTCENPHALLERYGKEQIQLEYLTDENELERAKMSWSEGYLHGDPFEERVLVLGAKNVAQMAKRVTLCNPGTSLRDDFLHRVEQTCRAAEAANEPVLLMSFCHGDSNPQGLGGLCLGIDPGTKSGTDFLSPKLLSQVLAKTPKVRVSLYLTSCYSGNWVITPEFKPLDTTVMAAAQQNEESFAWEHSSSLRHAGGVYTGAFLRELQHEPHELPDDADADESRTYTQVCRAVIAEASRLWVRVGGSVPMFTSNGGHDKFWKRTGFPLAAYKRNYDRLERVPASDPNPYRDSKRDPNNVPDSEYYAWLARHPEDAEEEYGSRSGGYGKTRRGLGSSLAYLAGRYMASHPGPRNAPSNTAMHNDIEMFQAGNYDNDINTIERVRSQVLYRIWMSELANKFRTHLNLNKIPIIENWDQQNPGPAGTLGQKNVPLVRAAALFERPDEEYGYWGQAWQKPVYYLATALAASDYGPEEVPKYLKMLNQLQHNFITYKIRKYTQLPTAQGSISRMTDIRKRSWGKSQQTPKRMSLEEAGMLDWEALLARNPYKGSKPKLSKS
ncbi:MAG: hypothetical protein Q9169_003500 [Polycauliona sp. 2 TL-2023]